MTINVIDDTSKSFGHALIIVDPAIDDTLAMAGVQIEKRSGEERGLSSHGWRAQAEVITPIKVSSDGNVTKISIGPPYVDQIPTDERVKVILPGAGISQEVHWPPIAPTPTSKTSGIDIGSVDGGKSKLTEKVSGPKREERSEDAETATPETVEVADDKPQRSSGMIAVLAAIVVLGLLGSAGYFLLPINTEGETVAQTEPSIATPAVSIPPAERYRQLLENDADGSGLFALFEELKSSEPMDYDLAYRALDTSSRRSNGQAYFHIGKIHDPLFFDRQWGLSEPNAEKAVKSYLKASEAGVSEADEARQGLCAEAEAPSTANADYFKANFVQDFCG